MKLYPKARPVRIKLTMGGEEHSSLESLRRHFDVKEVVRLWSVGALRNWLIQINRLDLMEAMNGLEGLPTVKQYEKCLNTFFDDIEGNPTIAERLVRWYDNDKNNYNCLISLALSNPIGEFISVGSLKTLKRKIEQKGNQEDLSFITNKVYSQVISIRTKIDELAYSLMNLKSATSSKSVSDKLDDLLIGLGRSWEIDISQKEEIQDKMLSIFKEIESSGLIGSKKFDFPYIHLGNEHWYNSEGIDNKKEIGIIETQVHLLNSYLFDIRYDRLSIFGLTNVNVIFRDKTESLIVTSNWDYLPGLSGTLSTPESFNHLVIAWRSVVWRVYLFKKAYMLKDHSDLYGKLGKHLENNGGKNGFSQLATTIFMASRVIDRVNQKNLTTLIYLNAVLIATLCLSKDNLKREKYLEFLITHRYRPAILLAQQDRPRTDLEKEFMELDDLERIAFSAKHILDL